MSLYRFINHQISELLKLLRHQVKAVNNKLDRVIFHMLLKMNTKIIPI